MSVPRRTASVDVVIPCYRYGAMLPLAVGTALDQPGVNVRVLVIDDASGDGSADVARRLAAADSRVEVAEHPVNRGHIATFNEGVMEWASADYTVLMSADDALTPGALGRATALLDSRPEVGLVYGRPILWPGGEPLPPPRTGAARWIVHDGHEWLRRMFERGRNCVYSPEVVVRTEMQKAVGGYNPELLHTSDLEMWMRFALRSDIGFLGGVDQAYYREHGANMSGSYNGSGGVGDLRMRWAAYISVVKGAGDLPEASELEQLVRRRLAREALARASRAHDEAKIEEHRAAELIEFAGEMLPQLSELREWRTYRLRRRLELRRPAAYVPLLAAAAGRRYRYVQSMRGIQRTGV